MFSLSSSDSKDDKTDYADRAYRSMKRWHIAKIVVFLLAFFFFLSHYFLYWDPGESCYISIKPAFLEFSNLTMKQALRTIKSASLEDYKTVCQNVSTIEPFIGCGGFGGGCYYTKEDAPQSSAGSEIVVSTSKDDLITTAAVIVHEACHAIQNREGRPLDETECYKMDDGLLRKIVTF